MTASNNTASSHCVIVGASHAGVQCALRLRRLGFDGRITLLGEESHSPYHRPPLSKDYLTGAKPLERIALLPAAGFEKNRIELQRSARAVAVRREQRQLELADSTTLEYDQLVLALGARVRTLDVPGSTLAGIHYLRHIDDVNGIRAQADSGARAVVVGGGYIGLETAASLRKLGLEVTIVESMARVLQRVTGPVVSDFYRNLHTSQGVTVLESDQVVSFQGQERVSAVELASGTLLPADLVVIGIGVIPNTDMAAAAGLAVDGGICVNGFAQTTDPRVYAVGDCASFVHPLYGQRMRIESVQHAGEQAFAAARAIVGEPEPYTAVPWFWSDQYNVKLQIAGLPVGADTSLVRGDPATGDGFSVLHFKDQRLLAIDAINRPKDFMQGRKLIGEGQALEAERLADPATPLMS